MTSNTTTPPTMNATGLTHVGIVPDEALPATGDGAAGAGGRNAPRIPLAVDPNELMRLAKSFICVSPIWLLLSSVSVTPGVTRRPANAGRSELPRISGRA